jgi:hypothetical protein
MLTKFRKVAVAGGLSLAATVFAGSRGFAQNTDPFSELLNLGPLNTASAPARVPDRRVGRVPDAPSKQEGDTAFVDAPSAAGPPSPPTPSVQAYSGQQPDDRAVSNGQGTPTDFGMPPPWGPQTHYSEPSVPVRSAPRPNDRPVSNGYATPRDLGLPSPAPDPSSVPGMPPLPAGFRWVPVPVSGYSQGAYYGGSQPPMRVNQPFTEYGQRYQPVEGLGGSGFRPQGGALPPDVPVPPSGGFQPPMRVNQPFTEYGQRYQPVEGFGGQTFGARRVDSGTPYLRKGDARPSVAPGPPSGRESDDNDDD